ncbi:MAG: NADH-quinone oxidoreductase subunit J family protein [Bryobacteraceae bacterium]
MWVDALFFYLFAAITLAGALLTITRRNAVHSAISLILSLIGVAGLFLLQKAEFLFAVQIVLYVGGVMVLFLFVIMLVNLDQAARMRQFSGQWWLALACVLAVATEIVYVLTRGSRSIQLAPSARPAGGGNVELVADVLFKQYLLPFELASILLLAAIVGSVIMARKRV